MDELCLLIIKANMRASLTLNEASLSECDTTLLVHFSRVLFVTIFIQLANHEITLALMRSNFHFRLPKTCIYSFNYNFETE